MHVVKCHAHFCAQIRVISKSSLREIGADPVYTAVQYL